MMDMRTVGRTLMTVAILVASVLPLVVDISHSHLLNPTWPPHARVHEVWLLATGASVGGVALWLTWMRDGSLCWLHPDRLHPWRLSDRGSNGTPLWRRAGRSRNRASAPQQ
jgi:hypothetical protein